MSCLAAFSLQWPQTFLGLWQHHSNLYCCLHMAAFPLSVCPSASCKDTHVAFRAHCSPGLPYLKTLN